MESEQPPVAAPPPSPAPPPAAPPGGVERRRSGWGEFRHAYPGIVATMGFALLVLISMDTWLIAKRVRYGSEIKRLRAGMTGAERKKTDLILATEQNKLRVMIELLKRQARGDKELHLSVSVDSGLMVLEREGALLREMRIEVGPEKTVGTSPDTVRMVIPRGQRTVERILQGSDTWELPRWLYADRGLPVPADRSSKGGLGPVSLVLTGGTVVYSMPTVGPLADSAYVMPGAVRARSADLKAIAPNLKPGMTIYFY